jgi:iron complex transport system substrate-binding protein
MNDELAADLNRMDIPTIIHSTDTIAQILDAVYIMGVLTGTTEAAGSLVEEKTIEINRVKAELAQKPLHLKGAFVYSLDPILGFTEDSLPGQILSLLGVDNIAAGLKTERPILTPEYLLAENPDFLLGAMSISSEDQILSADSMILKTRAGMEQNIWIVPSEMILRPTPRVVEALTMLHEDLSELTSK